MLFFIFFGREKGRNCSFNSQLESEHNSVVVADDVHNLREMEKVFSADLSGKMSTSKDENYWGWRKKLFQILSKFKQFE